MKPVNVAPACERGNDLISFLYGEADELEVQDFEKHLQHCSACKSEIASFGQLRTSVGAWKEEALSGFTFGQTAIEAPRKRSAVAALREFFDLAPLWMKGGLAFATVLFCLFAVLAIWRSRMPQTPIQTVNNGDARYSQDDVNRIVKEALEHESLSPQQTPESNPSGARLKPQKNPGNPTGGRSIQLAGSRRPLSRAEREQLAADLRLITPGDEEGLDLLGDRINQ